MVVSDHVNLTGESPVAGTEWGTDRFVNLADAYSPRLRALAAEVEPDVPEGVYAGLRGPHFETPAEIQMLRGMGADLVGMSTVLETIAARHCGLEVLGHDARRNSDVFAADAAALVAASGGEALFLGQAPTPVAAHAVVDRAADAGVVITASHNPPSDNGYKLYDSGGAQIIPPADAASGRSAKRCRS